MYVFINQILFIMNILKPFVKVIPDIFKYPFSSFGQATKFQFDKKIELFLDSDERTINCLFVHLRIY